MNKSQLNAISYAIMERKKREQMKVLEENNLMEEFKKSKYKTMTWFLTSKGL